MSIECGICERDLRGGHDPSCPRYRAPCCDQRDEEGWCPVHGQKPDAPAGDALDWARQWCDDIMLRYQNATNPGPLHAWLAIPLATLIAEERAAARAALAGEP